MAEREGSRTLARGLTLVTALGDFPDGVTVAQLSTEVSLDRAVVYRLLDTLVEHGFAVRDELTKRFTLGAALVELGVRAVEGLHVRRVAMPAMQGLLDRCHEAVCLTVRQGSDGVVVARVEPADHFVSVGYHVGFRHPLTQGAHGRALAGEGGAVVSTDELEVGTSGVAAAVHDERGDIVAALGVVAPTPRLADAKALGALVVDAAHQVSASLTTGS